MNGTLTQTLKELRLSGMAQSLEVRIQEASGNRLNPLEFLEIALQDELAVRRQRSIERRMKAACFRELRSLEDFDWSFNSSIPRARIFELATCQFLRERRDLLFLGPPGVGKSHLCQGLGRQAVKLGYKVLYRSIFDLVEDFLRDESFLEGDRVMDRYLKPDLLIIDDMGMKQLQKRAGEYLFEVILRRHEKQSTAMTSNRPIEDWGMLLQDVPTATAILDRFLQHAEILTLQGRSYRLKDRAVETAAVKA